MITVYVVAEGHTEKNFANGYLAETLYPAGISVEAMLVGKSGGLTKIAPLLDDLRELIRTHRKRPDVCFTTMVDFYKYPSDAPGWEEAKRRIGGVPRAVVLEAALQQEIDDPRFIPHLQVHEFEALLFTDPACLEYAYPNRPSAISSLLQVASEFASPEDINDSEQTAPSKRILQLIPDYRKVIAGSETAELIGLPAIRAKCPHFDAWVQKLERLATTTTPP